MALNVIVFKTNFTKCSYLELIQHHTIYLYKPLRHRLCGRYQ